MWTTRRLTSLFVSCVAATSLGVVVPGGTTVRADPTAIVATVSPEATSTLAKETLPARLAGLRPDRAVARVAGDPGLAVARADSRPDAAATDPAEAGLAALVSIRDEATVARVFHRLGDDTALWLALLFPSSVGNLNGAPYPVRIAANRIRVAAAIARSRGWPSPPRPWTARPRAPRAELAEIADRHRRLIYFDPRANAGRGAWAELLGDLGSARDVGVFVPGGSAFISSENFTRYSDRANSFVKAAKGRLAMIVWAASESPSGWVQEAYPGWARDSAPRLAGFVNDLRTQLRGRRVLLTVTGHSYGGAVVGLAETRRLDADRTLYLASAGAGYGVHSAADYARPCRPRFSLMASGDPIGYAQDIPGFTGLGHGADVADLAGTRRLATGRLPDDPSARDDVGRTLGSQDLTGKRIGGIHAHSEIFVPGSGAWRNMLAVLTGGHPRLASPPSPQPRCR